jgi:transcription elongation factor Elf1
MVDYIDLQHVMMLSNKLERFSIKNKSPYRINFRCIYCGDSQTSKSKARAWFLEDKYQSFRYFCHNCGESHSFVSFLRGFDTMAYNSYITDKYVNNVSRVDVPPTAKIEPTKEPPKLSINHLSKIKKISQLKFDHPAKLYIESRKIPTDQHYRIFYAPKFKTWVNSIIPEKLIFTRDEPRIVIPFLDSKGKMFGFTGRGFDPNGLRYLTIMMDEKPKIFGLDKVDSKKQYYVLEGAIDSLFVPNSIAMAGADGNLSGLDNVENAVFVFDLEYRNKEIMKRVEKIIDKGMKVCLFPKGMTKYGKDINDFVSSGLTSSYIVDMIKKNVYSGLEAKIKLIDLKNC